MSRRMTRRREDGDRAVAKHVMVAFELGHRVTWIKARPAVCSRPIVFGLLHIEHGLWEQFDIADVIGMGMRDRHAFDVGWLYSELIELSGERLTTLPIRSAVLTFQAIRHRGDLIGDAGIPEKPAALRVVDEVAVVGDIHRHPDIHAGRPARLVSGMPLAAAQDVKLVDAGGHCRRWRGAERT